MKPTTKNDFIAFNDEVRRMTDALQLGDWLIATAHEVLDHPVNGCMEADHEGRAAKLTLNHAIADNVDVRRVARHEVFELLLAPLARLARSRMLVPGEVEETTHAIIRRLERLHLILS